MYSATCTISNRWNSSAHRRHRRLEARHLVAEHESRCRSSARGEWTVGRAGSLHRTSAVEFAGAEGGGGARPKGRRPRLPHDALQQLGAPAPEELVTTGASPHLLERRRWRAHPARVPDVRRIWAAVTAAPTSRRDDPRRPPPLDGGGRGRVVHHLPGGIDEGGRRAALGHDGRRLRARPQKLQKAKRAARATAPTPPPRPIGGRRRRPPRRPRRCRPAQFAAVLVAAITSLSFPQPTSAPIRSRRSRPKAAQPTAARRRAAGGARRGRRADVPHRRAARAPWRSRPRRPPAPAPPHRGRRPARANKGRAALGRPRHAGRASAAVRTPTSAAAAAHLLPPSSSTVPAELGAALRAVLDAAELEKPTVGGRRAVLLTAAAAGEEEQPRLRGDGGGAARACARARRARRRRRRRRAADRQRRRRRAQRRRGQGRAIGALVGGGVGVLFAEVGAAGRAAVCGAPRRPDRSGDDGVETRTRGVT